MPDDVNPIPVEVLRKIVDEYAPTERAGPGFKELWALTEGCAAYALALRECLRVIVDGHDPYEEGGCIDLTRARALLGEDA